MNIRVIASETSNMILRDTQSLSLSVGPDYPECTIVHNQN